MMSEIAKFRPKKVDDEYVEEILPDPEDGEDKPWSPV